MGRSNNTSTYYNLIQVHTTQILNSMCQYVDEFDDNALLYVKRENCHCEQVQWKQDDWRAIESRHTVVGEPKHKIMHCNVCYVCVCLWIFSIRSFQSHIIINSSCLLLLYYIFCERMHAQVERHSLSVWCAQFGIRFGFRCVLSPAAYAICRQCTIDVHIVNYCNHALSL